MVAPKMIIASPSKKGLIVVATVFTSFSDIDLPPVTPKTTRRAPASGMSSSGDETAAIAASTARSRPEARPTPRRPRPAPVITERRSAKSMLTRPVRTRMSVRPTMPWRITSSASANESTRRRLGGAILRS